MGLRIYDRQVSYEVAYVRIDTENAAADLAEALADFGVEGTTWTVEPSCIVLSREMGAIEVPTASVVGQEPTKEGTDD